MRNYFKKTSKKPWALLLGAISEISSGDLRSGRSDEVCNAITGYFEVRRSMRYGVDP